MSYRTATEPSYERAQRLARLARRKRAQPERQVQRAVAEFLTRAAPPGLWWCAIPNGDRRVTLTPGTRAGAPDLLLIWRGRPIGIEMKAPRGAQSTLQKSAQLDWTLAGGIYHVARSVEEVEEVLRVVGVPLKARVAA